MIKRILLILFQVMLLPIIVHAASSTISVSSIEVRLFLAHTGLLSDPIHEDSILWNTIIGENESTRPSTSTLVKVMVIGPPGAYEKTASVILKISKTDSNEEPITLRKSLGVFDKEGKQYVAFWLPDSGCEVIIVSTYTTMSTKHISQRIPFQCGE